MKTCFPPLQMFFRIDQHIGRSFPARVGGDLTDGTQRRFLSAGNLLGVG